MHNVIEVENKFKKLPVDKILRESESVDSEKIAKEVVEWVANNVENYIDDNMKVFKIDLVLDSTEGLTETKKLQDLYRAIPDDSEKMSKSELEKLVSCRRILDEITSRAHYVMVHDSDSLQKLFDRMIFYYEKIIPNPENKEKAFEIDAKIRELLAKKDKAKTDKAKEKIQKEIMAKIDEGVKLLQFQKFDGSAAIIKFEYEAFDMGVELSRPKNPEQDVKTCSVREVIKKYSVPEGFTLWIELSYGIKKRPTTIF